MKALTLWQPWASLIAVGAKRIETRSWSTSYRGLLAIHAAARPCDMRVAASEPFWAAVKNGQMADLGWYEMFPRGVVIATCELVDVVPVDAAYVRRAPDIRGWTVIGVGDVFIGETERAFGNFNPGRFAWLLGNIVALDEPIPAKGRQGLWEWTP